MLWKTGQAGGFRSVRISRVLWVLGLDRALEAIGKSPTKDTHGKALEASRRPRAPCASVRPRKDEYDFLRSPVEEREVYIYIQLPGTLEKRAGRNCSKVTKQSDGNVCRALSPTATATSSDPMRSS